MVGGGWGNDVGRLRGEKELKGLPSHAVGTPPKAFPQGFCDVL